MLWYALFFLWCTFLWEGRAGIVCTCTFVGGAMIYTFTTYLHTHTHTHTHIHTYTCTYTCTHIHMYTCTHTHTHTYSMLALTHTHTFDPNPFMYCFKAQQKAQLTYMYMRHTTFSPFSCQIHNVFPSSWDTVVLYCDYS